MNSFMFVCLFGALTHEYMFLTRLAASTTRSVLVVVLVAQVAHPISLLKILSAIPEVAEFAAREIVVATRRARPVAWLLDLGILVDAGCISENTLCGRECDKPKQLP